MTPYASAVGTRTGSISEINPLVDENGMVRVKAQVNGGDKFFDGMNVRISVKRSVPNRIVVPKTAIVLRSGKQVMFTVYCHVELCNYRIGEPHRIYAHKLRSKRFAGSHHLLYH